MIMFVVCFAGVLAALLLHDSIDEKNSGVQGAKSLEQFVSTVPATNSAAGETDFTAASKKLMPAVVSIDSMASSPFDSDGRPEVASQGSGVIITSDGYIITNYHVIAGAQEVVVRTVSGKQFPAKPVGLDAISDLALIKVEASGLPAAELGDSDDLKIGQWVLAVGNPLGYEGTLSVGIVSALNRDLPMGPSPAPLVGAIQTDAAINQGNSGGALANIRGQVVGINTQIATPNRGSVGIGFAIPSNRVRKVVDDIRKYGRVRHADLGIRKFGPSWWLQHPEFARAVGAEPPEQGLVINSITEGSPLAKAGVKRFDVLIAIDDKPIASINDYLTYLVKADLGQKAKVKYWSHGAMKETVVQLAEVQQG